MQARLPARSLTVLALFALAVFAGSVIFWFAGTALYNRAHLSGWALFALGLLAGLYGARRAFLNVAGSTHFLIHISIGALAALLFFVHAGAPPAGAFGLLLWVLFFIVLLSGAVGIVCEKFLARRRRSQEPYASIAPARAAFAKRADEVYQKLLNDRPPLAFTQYYARRVVPYFAAHANFWAHWLGLPRALDGMLDEMEYLGSELDESPYLHRLRKLVRDKNELDRHYALYWLQRGWLFIHLPAVVAAAVLTVAHIFLVFAFGG